MRFVVLEDQGVTPGCCNGSIEVIADDPITAVSKITGVAIENLKSVDFGAAGTWQIWAEGIPSITVCVLVVLR